ETKRPHSGDLAPAFRDGGVHRVERPENGTNGHYRRDQSTEHTDEGGHGARLFFVVVEFALYLHCQARIGGDGILELVISLRRLEVHGERLEAVLRTLVDLVKDCAVAPKLGVEGAAPGVKHTNDHPL